MLEFIDRTEYARISGKSIPDNFESLVIEASSYINRMTFDRIAEIDDTLKYVTCEIINTLIEEKIKISEISNLKSQSIEGWSETYATPEEVNKEYSNKKYSILQNYLWNVIGVDGNPLLYCGVC